jgi:F-type H+-transporting ATPase subunit b
VIPDLSVFWVILSVLVLATILNQLLFKPLTQVIAEREAAVTKARRQSDEAAAKARAASEEFTRRTDEARVDVFRQLEEARKAALDRRAHQLADTRREAETTIAEAGARLRDEAATARAALDRDAESMATTIVERVLGRTAS